MAVSRKENEKDFFNVEAEQESRSKVNSKYHYFTSSQQKYTDFILKNSAGKTILELGCGVDSSAKLLAQNGAEVYGIDISDKAVDLAVENAKKSNIKNIHLSVMDAEHLNFEKNKFDLLCGVAILHHLQIEAAFREICSVLKPDGTAVFIEPLGHNPFINLFRKLTPQLRTEDEHPFKKEDIAFIQNYFHESELTFFYLFSLGALPLKGTFLFKPIYSLLSLLDKLVFAVFPFARFYSWQILIVLKSPKK